MFLCLLTAEMRFVPSFATSDVDARLIDLDRATHGHTSARAPWASFFVWTSAGVNQVTLADMGFDDQFH